jgi:16S rRNA (cytosine967-C5)-methyltransferase
MNQRNAPSAREIALEALARVDDGAYANIALPALLTELDRQFHLEDREKNFATELTYGTVRMRRACDWLVQRHITRDSDDETLRVLHLGAYQLVFLQTPPHAAVSEMVDLSPNWSTKFVNFVLRRVAEDLNPKWPDLATQLSYPDWIIRALNADLGAAESRRVLESMNNSASVSTRDDGYVQDPASQMVARSVEARSGERVLDLCAAPGGKATLIASSGAHVVAVDLHEHRSKLVEENADRLGLTEYIEVLTGDATTMYFDQGSFERVLVDAPCSGLGSLRRRPDARWRITESDVVDLVKLQRALMTVAANAVKPGGVVVYSACTLTRPESLGLDEWVQETHPELVPIARIEGVGWEPLGNGARLLPNETDGMVVFRYQRSAASYPAIAAPLTCEAIDVEVAGVEVVDVEVVDVEVVDVEVVDVEVVDVEVVDVEVVEIAANDEADFDPYNP